MIQQRIERRQLRPCPPDFAETFVLIGRLACEEHYGAGRLTINRWLAESDKAALLKERAKEAAKQGHVGPNAVSRYGRETVDNWRAEGGKLTRVEVGKILDQAIPVSRNRIGFTLARRAAQHLRIVRNGGFIVSPAGGDMWWVGTKRITAEAMVELAKAKGFDPNLSERG
jgi:hypothetical protein